jgi:hypothetical protein
LMHASPFPPPSCPFFLPLPSEFYGCQPVPSIA